MPSPTDPPGLTDRELALAALDGDRFALETLIRWHAPAMRMAVAHSLPGRAASHADDVYQTVLLKLCEHGARVLGRWSGIVHPGAPDESIAPYLCRIARNCAVDVLRRIRREIPVDELPDGPDAHDPLFVLDLDVDPSVAAELEFHRRLVRECLDALPSGTRAALRQFLLGATGREAARTLAISSGAYRERVRAGKQLLAECIAHRAAAHGRPDFPGHSRVRDE